MTRKGWIISAVVGLLIAIGIGSTFVFSSGKGEVMELSPLEMKKFMSEDGTGFVILNNDKKTRADILFKVEKLAKQNNILVRELFGGREDVPRTSNQHDFGLSQKRDTLAYYEKGELKKSIKFEEIKPSDFEKEVTYFVQNCKEQYQK
ncbi:MULTISPECIES: hypothetical protein [Bacillus cereus group]|uniref:Uncharacterized protein n=3 Tax=Bacillus cereus group TaxID=86661 RepID=A0A2B5VND9_9BACI|nr:MULTISPECIES: hypothetical protein [Bacillus cereus group]PEJ88758.1 hypothetical protein CN688_27275 [Bacillus toyonensis]PEL15055.1 hypothetical protein CN624_32115 [Bacillus toyonensis]PEO53522.1 hypothetical protein CN579_24885 [Bacillus toyonensis]PFS10945.1 hypothetical protein COK46_26210 [Bacillus thuringiensis]PGA73062.1 hypothetical protein COL90_27965 [Bacillus toyonensis]